VSKYYFCICQNISKIKLNKVIVSSMILSLNDTLLYYLSVTSLKIY